MPAGRLSDRHLAIGAIGLTALLVMAGAALVPPGSGAAAPSSLSPAAAGGKAAYETLAALGYRIERSYEPLASLRTDPATATLLVTGSLEPSEQDRRALKAFVEAGGDVLLVGAHGAHFIGVDGGPGTPAARPPNVHRVIAPSPLSAGVTEITMGGHAGQPRFGDAYVTLFAVNEQTPLVTTARIGLGRVTWLAAATPLENAHLPAAGNLQLLLNVAGSPGARRVLWDEHYHGHTRSLWSYLVKTPLPWAGGQVALIAFAVLAAYSRRRGPIRPAVGEPRTSPLEFIRMLGEMYRRSASHGAAVTAARLRLGRTVASTCGVPPDGTDAQVARAIVSKTGADPREVSAALEDARNAAADPAITGAAAVLVAARLQRLTGRLTAAAAGRHSGAGPVHPAEEERIVERAR